jgi:shikimate dehydrogenase
VLRAQATRLAGLLGWPLAYTLSPAIHNAAFRARGLDWIYLPFPVRPDRLRDAVGGLRALGALGANVTMPHKESIVGLLDDVSADVRALGAVNTVQRVGDRLVGHNTDVEGFREFLIGDAGVEVAGKRALVLGAGGAARAVARALCELDAMEIAVAARQEERARTLVRAGGDERLRPVEWGMAEAVMRGADIVVNATPLGAQGEKLFPDPRLRAGVVVVDLVYHPPTTPLIEQARAAGAHAWGGLGMLIRQAAASFRLWTGQAAPLETMSAAAVRALGSGPGRPDSQSRL